MTTPSIVYLVSCVKQKAAAPTAARDLYLSDWFRKARAYVEATGAPWYILSAEHGLLSPDAVVAPYEKTLNAMTAPERRAWGLRVADQLEQAIGSDPGDVVFFAGARYREPLAHWAGSRMVAPLSRLGIGSQKAWLVRNRPIPVGAI